MVRRLSLFATFLGALLTIELVSGALVGAEQMDSFTPSEEFQSFITDIARKHLPDHYEKKKNWGKQVPVFRGWEVKRDGWELHTRRKWKLENDGGWQWYRVDLVDPDHRLQVRISNIRAGQAEMLADIEVVSRLHVEGRHSQWENGLQLISVSAEADARVRMTATVSIKVKLDGSKSPPDILIEPVVKTADLELQEFKLARLSHFSGPVVKSLSATIREFAEDKIAEDREKLTEKANQSIAKQKSKLRISLAKALHSPWAEFVSRSTKE